MSPTNSTAIAETVAKLLNHYATAAEPLEVRRAIARDWVEDLAEFTPQQVEGACREWRRMQSMRPAISDIRKLAIAAQHLDRDRRAVTDQRISERADDDVRRMWDQPEYHGDFRTWQQRRQDAIERQDERYRRGEAWRDGKLDDYDARHHPERLAERQARGEPPNRKPVVAQHVSNAVADALKNLGVTATEEVTEPQGTA